jgi:hypothetical protein
MTLVSRISALIGAAAFMIGAVGIAPGALAASKMKMKHGKTVVHGFTRKMKSGKIVNVKSYTRSSAGKSKMVKVHGYTRKTKSGKIVHVKSYTRKAPGTHKKTM